MKRRKLLQILKEIARQTGHALELQEGGNHTKARIGDRVQPIPRHREIPDMLAKAIIKELSR